MCMCHIRTSEAFMSMWQRVVSKPFTRTPADSDKTDTSHIPALPCASLEGKQQLVKGETGVPACQCVIPDTSHTASLLMGKSKLTTHWLVCVYVCVCTSERVRACTQHPWLACAKSKRRHHLWSGGTSKRLLLLALEVLLSDTVCKSLTQSASVDTWQNMPTVQAKQPESRDFSLCRFQGDLSLLCSRILLSKYEATGQVFTYECLFSDKKYKLNYKFMQFCMYGHRLTAS